MLIKRYLPEGICLSLYAIIAIVLIDISIKNEVILLKLTATQALEKIVPKQTSEMLNTNFTSNLHYDLYAQLQLEIEKQLLWLSPKDEVFNQVGSFNELSSNYMQLTTMIKTSTRLVTFADQDNSQLHEQINDRLLKLLISPSEHTKQALVSLMTDAENNTQLNQNTMSWDMIKDHIQFIIDNIDNSITIKEQILSHSVFDAITKQSQLFSEEYHSNETHILIYYFGIISCFLVIFIIVLKRQQKELKRKTQLHKEAADVKTQFLANMSHEIRTPITGIIGLIELCQDTQLSVIQSDYIQKLSFSANSLLGIINDILDFSKIEAGKLKLDYVEFDHERLFENLSFMIGKTAENKGIELIFDLDSSATVWIKSDPVRITQVLLNLISNAVKFTDEGHIVISAQITSSQAQIDQPSPLFEIEYMIKDTGIGLTNSQINKLFERFVQADDSTTRKYGGTGLGLSICRSLTDMLGGTIRVESKINIGSSFYVNLPVEIIEKKPQQDVEFPVARVHYPALQGKRLLLLEDNPVTSSVIEAIANQIEINITLVRRISEAIDACNNIQFDFAIIDWHLSNESGLDFITQIQAQQCTPNKIIICSALNRKHIEDTNDLLSEYPFLAKPFTAYQLCDVLNSPELNRAETSHSQIVKNKSSKPKVLLVEDNKINQTIASTLLRKMGLEVDIAENGLEAIERVKSNNYPLVLMDIRMPVMDGIEATKVLRKDYSKESLIIIALTANVTTEEISYYLEIGMNSHLCKPYDRDEIVKQLSMYVPITP